MALLGTTTGMPRQSPLIRQWTLLKTLCARRHGATVNELAEERGVGEKTIRRDLETFQVAGFPLVETVEDFGRKKWHIDSTNQQPGLCFAYDEAIALYLGRRFMAASHGERLVQHHSSRHSAGNRPHSCRLSTPAGP
jgi:predicted DNA-binding transcriptional regulator YafY